MAASAEQARSARVRGTTSEDAAAGDLERRRRRWAVGTAIVLAPLVVYVVVDRCVGAMTASPGYDFGLFLDAARALRGGSTPYDVEWYVYSPLLAVVLAPLTIFSTGSVWDVWCIAETAALVLACAACVRALRLPWHWWPVAFAGFVVTLFELWSVTMLFTLGQTDGFLLACFALGALGATRSTRPGLLGTAIGIATLLKTWPFATAAFLARRIDAERRRREALALTICLVVGVVATVALLGVGGLGDWAGRTVDKSSQPGLVSISVVGIPRLLFKGSSDVPPLAVSPALQLAAMVVLAVLVGTALFVAVRRTTGDPYLGWWLTIGAVVLLLPVSHVWYRLFLLPLAWGWAARASRRRERWSIAMAVVAVGWWLVAWHVETPGQGTFMRPFLVLFVTDFALVLGSAFALWHLDRSTDEELSPEPAPVPRPRR